MACVLVQTTGFEPKLRDTFWQWRVVAKIDFLSHVVVVFLAVVPKKIWRHTIKLSIVL
jgi:hypothetical protein